MAAKGKPKNPSCITLSFNREFVPFGQLPTTTHRGPAFYKITHVPTGKYYVGSSGNMLVRRWDHLKLLNAGKHPNKPFQEIFKIGDHLHFDITPVPNRQKAYDLELEALKANKHDLTMLNVFRDSVFGHAPGVVFSEVTRAKIAAYRGDKHHFYGKKFSEDHKRNISESLKGRTFSPEAIERMRKTKKAQLRIAGNSVAAQKISVDGVVYDCIGDAARALGTTESSVRSRLKSRMPAYASWVRLSAPRKRYIGRRQKGRPVSISGKLYANITDAAFDLGMDYRQVMARVYSKGNRYIDWKLVD